MTAISKLSQLEQKATKGPWKWSDACEMGPQLEGNVEHPEMSPILVAAGCGNTNGDGVKGCIPKLGGDELRACPLHPTKDDRDFIATFRTAAPSLLAYVLALENLAEHWDKKPETLNEGWYDCLYLLKERVVLARQALEEGVNG